MLDSVQKPAVEVAVVVVAANTLLSAVASSFVRINTSFSATSRKLAESCDRIRAASLTRSAAR